MDPERRFLIVGAGVSGAALAGSLAKLGLRSLVIDRRDHVAGNCHSSRDASTGILVHRYGPHIFHTNDDAVWSYVKEHADFVPYRHAVSTTSHGRVFSLPINLQTINQFFHTSFTQEEAKKHVASLAHAIPEPRNFEEQALAMIGEELYLAFFKGYTTKQWGVSPNMLPANIFKRIPVRFDDNCSYFHHERQAMPRDGYTTMVESMLASDLIELRLKTSWPLEPSSEEFSHVFFSGPLDEYFQYRAGRLGYRTLDFETLRSDKPLQGIAVMNYADENVPWTRVTEHRYLAPWENHEGTVAYRERSRACGQNDIPYYPIHLVGDQPILSAYLAMASAQQGVTFLGRLGCYAYLDMDVAIGKALVVGAEVKRSLQENLCLPAFITSVRQ